MLLLRLLLLLLLLQVLEQLVSKLLRHMPLLQRTLDNNALLDVLLSTEPSSPYRHVRPLLEQGRLRLDMAPAQMALGSLVGQQIAAGVIFTQQHVDALVARTRVADLITHTQVGAALAQGGA